MREADLRKARLSGADMQGVDMRGAKILADTLGDPTSLKGATLPAATKK
jgi:uncharacterized protein YjbI with pentapeptide repeats